LELDSDLVRNGLTAVLHIPEEGDQTNIYFYDLAFSICLFHDKCQSYNHEKTIHVSFMPNIKVTNSVCP